MSRIEFQSPILEQNRALSRAKRIVGYKKKILASKKNFIYSILGDVVY